MPIEKLVSGSVLVVNMGPKSIGVLKESELIDKLPDESLHGLIYYEQHKKGFRSCLYR